MKRNQGIFFLRCREQGSRAGFSLLEVVLTLAVLASVTLGTTILLVPIARESRSSAEVQTANLAARGVLERIQATPFKDITVLYPQGSVHAVANLPGGQIAITYDDPAADPLMVRADLTWNSPDSGAMTRSFQTVRTE
jgi:prepilin-type N-terminal cleavage/methylation domain-containing protein